MACFLDRGEQEDKAMLSGIEEFIFFGFMPLVIGILAGPGTPSDAAENTLSGRLTLPPARSLPDGAVATVELVEQRRGATVLPALARETLRWRGGQSQKFAIRFDPSLVHSTGHYGLRASVIADGVVRFETPYPQLASLLCGDATELALVPVMRG
jgi:putative lipoprotein